MFDRVENIVRKGEIAYTSNISFSRNVIKRLLSKIRQKSVIVWEWVKDIFFNSVWYPGKLLSFWWFLTPLAESQRAIVMALCPLSVCPWVGP